MRPGYEIISSKMPAKWNSFYTGVIEIQWKLESKGQNLKVDEAGWRFGK